MLVLSQTGLDSPLGFVLPLALLGVGHGFLMVGFTLCAVGAQFALQLQRQRRGSRSASTPCMTPARTGSTGPGCR